MECSHKGFLTCHKNICKIKGVEVCLKKWSKSISKLKLLIENCNRILLQIDNLEDLRQLYIPEANFRKILKAHLLRLLKYQNEYWKKHCTFRWAVQGEENTKYFQARATERLWRNAITNLVLPDGRLIENHDEKAASFHDCFKKRMGVSSQPVYDFDLADLIQKCQGLEELSIPFAKE